MRGMFRRAVVGAATLALALGTVATTQPSTELVPRTETLYIAAGCPQDTPGTCQSIRWLGRTPGDATSNFLTSTLPVDEVLYHVEGEPNWRDYVGDDSLRDSYALDHTRAGKGVVELQSTGPGIQSTLHFRVTATTDDLRFLTLTEQSQTVTLMTGTTVFEFPFELDDFAGQEINGLTVEVALHGVNVSAGRINQQGGSWLELPWLEEVAVS